MKQIISLLFSAALTAATMWAGETKTAVFDFTQPSTITPSQYAPVVPETDRESRYEVDINGVTFKSSDVSFTVKAKSTGGCEITEKIC